MQKIVTLWLFYFDQKSLAGFQGFFKWSEYLAGPGRIPAPAHLFMEVFDMIVQCSHHACLVAGTGTMLHTRHCDPCHIFNIDHVISLVLCALKLLGFVSMLFRN